MPANSHNPSIDVGRLPSGPRVLSRLVSLVHQPEVHLEAVAELFRSDPALSARVVSACTSPIYARTNGAGEIHEAILVLGVKELTRIVHVVTMTDLRKYPTHLYHFAAGHFWERSLHTAYVCEDLGKEDPLAFTAGIMHLVGVWVLCSVFPAGSMPIVARELALQAEIEELRMGLNFAAVGGTALFQWG